MSDPTIAAKVYRDQGGNEIVVENGGVITVKSGGAINVLSGGSCNGTVVTVSASAIADLTNNSGGATADGTIAAVRSDTLAHAAADTNDAITELVAKIEAILAALRSTTVISS